MAWRFERQVIREEVVDREDDLVRLASDDGKGRSKTCLGQRGFRLDLFPKDGGIAVYRGKEMQKLMRFVQRPGFKHHVAKGRRHHADVPPLCGCQDALAKNNPLPNIKAKTQWMRLRSIQMVHRAQRGHPGGGVSANDRGRRCISAV